MQRLGDGGKIIGKEHNNYHKNDVSSLMFIKVRVG